MFILIYLCLPEVNLEECQSCPRPHIPPTSDNLGYDNYYLTYTLIPLLSVIFVLPHKKSVSCVLW